MLLALRTLSANGNRCFPNNRKYITVYIVCKELSTLSCRVSNIRRLAKVADVLAIRQVKHGTETTRFRIGFTLHSYQYDSS